MYWGHTGTSLLVMYLPPVFKELVLLINTLCCYLPLCALGCIFGNIELKLFLDVLDRVEKVVFQIFNWKKP